MKHCRKFDEPQELAELREQDSECDWDGLRDGHQSCYDAIIKQLDVDQGGLCSYCERRLVDADMQVAHFHPKSDSTPEKNWALDWTNLWMACKGGTYRYSGSATAWMDPVSENRSCDEATENDNVDDVVYSPAQVPANPRIFKFRQSADALEIVVDEEAVGKSGLSQERVQATIDTFNLNCRRLLAARISVYKPIENAVKIIREHPQDERRLELFRGLAKTHLVQPGGGFPEFFTMIRWRFGSAAEDFLQSINYEG
jgi:uncharacterized protein (TIGR02646 family)